MFEYEAAAQVLFQNEHKGMYVLEKDRDYNYRPPSEISIKAAEYDLQKARVAKSEFKHRFLLSNLDIKDILVSNMLDVPISTISYKEGFQVISGHVRGRTSEEFKSLVGWKRNPTDLIKQGFSFIYDNENCVHINDEIQESLRHYQDSIEKRFETNLVENNHDTNLWEEVQGRESSDIFEYFSDKQKEIKDTWRKYNEIEILGLAGSGKTIILNEVFLLEDADAWLIVPNFKLRDKAVKFIEETSNSGKEQRILTYDQLETMIINNFFKEMNLNFEFFKHFSSQEIFVGNKILSIRLPLRFKVIELLIQENVTINSPYMQCARIFSDRLSLLRSSIDNYSKRIAFMRSKAERNRFDKEVNVAKDIEVFESKISNHELEIEFINGLMNYQNFEPFIRSEMPRLKKIWELFSKSSDGNANTLSLKIQDFVEKIQLRECFIFDEAPMMVEGELLLHLLPKMRRKIYGYDKFQYPSDVFEKFKESTDIDKEYILDSIFRTTKQIFEQATIEHPRHKIALPRYKAMISKEGSLTDEIQEVIIRLTDVIKKPGEYWGVEFDNLTVIIDTEITRDNLNFYYLATTRAVKKLNIQYEI